MRPRGYRHIEVARALGIAGVLLVLTACARTAAPAPAPRAAAAVPRPPSRDAVARVARDSLSSWAETGGVTVVDESGAWHVQIVLKSAPPTTAVDMAAVRILAAVASEDPSDTPVYFSVIGPGLGLSARRDAWGTMFYQWTTLRKNGIGRGEDVMLGRGDTGDPHGPPCLCSYGGVTRGYWRSVDGAKLRQWASGKTRPQLDAPGLVDPAFGG